MSLHGTAPRRATHTMEAKSQWSIIAMRHRDKHLSIFTKAKRDQAGIKYTDGRQKAAFAGIKQIPLSSQYKVALMKASPHQCTQQLPAAAPMPTVFCIFFETFVMMSRSRSSMRSQYSPQILLTEALNLPRLINILRFNES